MKVIVGRDEDRKKKGFSYWCVTYFPEGKRKRKFFSSRTEAYEFKKELKGPIESGEDRASPNNTIRLDTALTLHMEALIGRGAREETIISRRSKCKKFVKAMENARLSKVTRKIFKEYILTGKTESTRKTTRSEVGGFLNWCFDNEKTSVLFKGITWESKLEDEKLVESLDPKEAKDLMQAMPDGYKAAMALMLFAGIRPYEVPRIKWELVYPQKDLIIIEGVSSKTRKNRKLTNLPKNLWAWINEYKDMAGFDRFGKFVPFDGPINDYRTFAKHRKRACRQAGILYPHDVARHSFGTYGLWHGGKAWAMRLMGHSNEKVFEAHYNDTGRSKDEAKEYFSVSA